MTRCFFSTLFLAALLLPIHSNVSTAQEKDIFNLSVQINDLYNPNFQVCVPIVVDKPFKIAWQSENVKSSISGILHPLDGEEYPLTFTVSEWASEQRSGRDTSELNLKLEKPYEWGFVQSIMVSGRVNLSKDDCK